MLIAVAPSAWEYAVLTVKIVEMKDSGWTYQATAWRDSEEIYSRTLESMFWSAPLAELGRQGWELVGTTSENALMGSWVHGWNAETSRPVQTNFFFKRPCTS